MAEVAPPGRRSTLRSRVKRGLELLRADLARERGSKAWSLFLVRALDLAPPSVTLMSTTLKLGAAAAALLVLAGILLLESGPRREPEGLQAAPARTTELSAEVLPGDVEAVHGERRALDASIRPEAPARTSSPRTGNVVLRVAWAEDRSPAAEVSVRVQSLVPAPWFRRGRPRRRRSARSPRAEPGLIVAQTDPRRSRDRRSRRRRDGRGAARIPVGISVRPRGDVRRRRSRTPNCSSRWRRGIPVRGRHRRAHRRARRLHPPHRPGGSRACLRARGGFAPSSR